MSNLKIAAEKYDVQNGLLKKEGKGTIMGRVNNMTRSLLLQIDQENQIRLVNYVRITIFKIVTCMWRTFFDESAMLLSWNGNPENFNRPGTKADFITCMVSLAKAIAYRCGAVVWSRVFPEPPFRRRKLHTILQLQFLIIVNILRTIFHWLIYWDRSNHWNCFLFRL